MKVARFHEVGSRVTKSLFW